MYSISTLYLWNFHFSTSILFTFSPSELPTFPLLDIYSYLLPLIKFSTFSTWNLPISPLPIFLLLNFLFSPLKTFFFFLSQTSYIFLSQLPAFLSYTSYFFLTNTFQLFCSKHPTSSYSQTPSSSSILPFYSSFNLSSVNFLHFPQPISLPIFLVPTFLYLLCPDVSLSWACYSCISSWRRRLWARTSPTARRTSPSRLSTARTSRWGPPAMCKFFLAFLRHFVHIFFVLQHFLERLCCLFSRIS